MTYDYDFLVIGGGSAGVRAARRAAALGKKVAIAEGRDWGGTCVVRGCVPKKLLVYAADAGRAYSAARHFGWQNTADASVIDWHTLRDNVQQEVARLSGVYAQLLDSSGVTRHHGWAQFVAPHTVVINHQQITAENILIAVGGAPIKPKPFGWTSDDMFVLDTLPTHCTVYGAGYIGAEFANILHGLGVQVTWAYRGDTPLRGFDADLVQHLTTAYAHKGIALQPNTQVDDMTPQNPVLWAVGRRPVTENLGLHTVGITPQADGTIVVDHTLRAAQNIFAAGDVLGKVPLTPVALHEAECVVDILYGTGTRRPDYALIPSAVFSRPELAVIGCTEQDAQGFAHDVYITRFKPMSQAFVPQSTDKILMKLIVRQADNVVCGIHIAGEGAAEMMQCIGVAVKMGLTKMQLDAIMPIHPTAAEELVTMRTKRV